MTDDNNASILSRIAHLSNQDDGEYPHIVHGVAHGEDELTNGLNGLKYWPADAVERASASLQGQAVFKIHGDGDRKQVGTVLRSAYEPGVGVVYEAGLSDEEIANELSLGKREVSIEATATNVERDPNTGAAIQKEYQYTGLATPKKGASEGNYTAAGPASGNPAIAALSADAIQSALATSKAGVTYQGTKGGKLDESAIPSDDFKSHYLFDGDSKSASSYPVVDADGYLRRGNVKAAYKMGARGVSEETLHRKLKKLNSAFDNPPIDEANLAQNLNDAMSPETGQAEDSVRGSTNTHSDTMSEENETPDVSALLERVDEKDERIEELEGELSEKDDRIAELSDHGEEIKEVKQAYAAALAGADTMLDEEDFVERFTVAELREKVDSRDDAALVDPDPEPDVQSGGGDGGDDMTANLADNRDEIASLASRARTFDGIDDGHAESLRSKAAELAGVDDFEAIEEDL